MYYKIIKNIVNFYIFYKTSHNKFSNNVLIKKCLK